MQILPSRNATRAKAGLETLGGFTPRSCLRQAKAFSSYFDACLTSAQGAASEGIGGAARNVAGKALSRLDAGNRESSANAANKAALATSGLLSSGTGNVVSDPKTVRMTREDFAQLRSSLFQNGISEKEIKELEARIDTPQGLTWGVFMSFLQEKMLDGASKGALGAEDKRQVQSFLGKLGFTPGEISQLVTDMEQGQAAKAWGVISTKLAGLSFETASSVTASEVQSLAKSLGLSATAQDRLSELFSRMGESDPAGRDIRTALFAIAAEARNKAVSDGSSLAQVKALASQVFVAAQKREFGQILADSREDQVARKALLAKEMAAGKEKDDEASASSGTRNVADLNFASSRNAGVAARSGKGNDQSSGLDQDAAHKRVVLSGEGREDGDQRGLQGLTGASAAAKDRGVAGGAASGRQETATEERGARERAFTGQHGMERGDAERRQGGASTDADWMGFWRKIGLDAGPGITGAADALKASAAAFTPASTSPRMAQTAARPMESYVSADVLRQVENGMLKNLGQGGHRITLNLTPDELGSVTVMLTVKDKDVQATIKAETPEAARIISEHLTRVRENLEQQGLRVSKLDVQTGLAQQQDQSAWQGTGQHNEARRQQEELNMRRTALRLLEMRPGVAMDSDISLEHHVPRHGTEGVDVFA